MRSRPAVALFAALAVLWTATPRADAAMTTNWNPHAATTIGLETFPTVQGDQLVAGGAGSAARFTSTAVETIDRLRFWLADASPQAVRLLAEVYPVGQEVPGAIATATFRPNLDLLNQGGGWIRGSTSGGLGSIGTTNLFQRIDEPTLDVDDWIAYNAAAGRRFVYRANFDTAAWPANRRVVGGRVRLVANRKEINGKLDVIYWSGSNAYRLDTITVTPNRRTHIVAWPEYNPATLLPWTRAEIQALDAGAGLALRPQGVGRSKLLRVFQWEVNLDYVTENRVAVGTVQVSSGDAGGWVSVNLSAANSGAATWTKANGQQYTVLLRRISGNGYARWRYLEETPEVAELLGHSTPGQMVPVSTFLPTLDARGFVSSMGDQVPGRMLAFYFITSAPAESVDGQPYHQFVADAPSPASMRSENFTVTTAGTYGRLRFLLVENGANAGSPTVRRLSIDVYDQLPAGGGPISRWSTVIDDAALATFPIVGTYAPGDLGEEAPIRLVDLDISAALTAGAGRALLFGFSQGTGGLRVLMVDADPAGEASFGGTTSRVTNYDPHPPPGPGAAVVWPDRDIIFTLSLAPTVPANFAATVATESTGIDGVCTVENVQRAQLAWTSTTLGGSFARYEIQRRQTRGSEQLDEIIARPPLEATHTLPDWDTLQGQNQYRIRVVRAGDLMPSAWSAWRAIAVDLLGADVKISSNHAGTALAFVRDGGDYQFDWPFEWEAHGMAGRDGRVVFAQAENQGDDVELPLVIYAAPDPSTVLPTPGRQMFEPLRQFLRQPVPHWTVADRDGWRWLGRVVPVRGRRAEPGNRYAADTQIVEAQFEPTPTE